MRNVSISFIALGVLLASAAAHAAPGVASGQYGNFAWKAQNSIVGQTSTATLAGGGDPLYFPSYPEYNGVVSIIMEYDDGGFICSGTLLEDRRSIATAAHCVTIGGVLPNRTTVYFYGGPDADTVTFLSPDAERRKVSQIAVNPLYTGNVIDNNDIAVLRLSAEAPDFANSFALYEADDLTGLEFNVAGYGARSDTGGAVGDNLGVGRLRQGDNRFDYRMGDADFLVIEEGVEVNGWELIFGQPTEELAHSWLSDFDNGLEANDTSCELAADPFFALSGAKFCNTGLGEIEVSVAGGDSGGPQFIDGQLAAVTSYGLSFGPFYGDVDDALNSSCGEFNGFVPIYLHRDFINAALVPAPAGFALVGLGLAGLVGLRRCR